MRGAEPRGLVDACATATATFAGATTVFKTLKLYADNLGLSRLERCESAWIGARFELDEDTRTAPRASGHQNQTPRASRGASPVPGDPGDPGDGSVMEGDAHGSK